MAADVTIPRLGWSMEEGVFAGWIKKPGDTVKPGEPLFMLEGEKATQEIESVDAGVLHLAPDAPSEGQTVLVGRTIAKLCAAGETPAWGTAANPPAAVAAPAAAAPPRASGAPPAPPVAERHPAAVAPAPATRAIPAPATRAIPVAASPSVRRLARQMGIDLATVAPRLPGGRLSAEDLATGNRGGGPAARPAAPAHGTAQALLPAGSSRSSPRARRVARDRGVDVATIRGSGAGGRVRERDVLAAAQAGATPRGRGAAGAAAGATVMPITQTRRTIARQMVRSRQETVPVTLTAWADATALLAARAALKAAGGPEAATLNDMLLKAVADTLLAHPLLAARWEETQLALPGDRIDIGLAVDAPGGLVVPVVRDVAAAPLAEVARQTRWLVERARSGRLTAADMQGGVFTLTSLGSYGIEFFTPVINHPEAAILGVGAIRMHPVPPPGGQEGFVLQRQLPLSLTFDHRIVDGGPAARFLGDLAARIAEK
ncbi:MAG: 2-oxo acid dehydrogenase subunit E2 [Planctomycetaceae bacterium]|nr:2-oxo acid dehydrogenase subunit E2 [Planctomycetaceae bacterium]